MTAYSLTVNIEDQVLQVLKNGKYVLCFAAGVGDPYNPVYNVVAIADPVHASNNTITWTANYAIAATTQTFRAGEVVAKSSAERLPIAYGQAYNLKALEHKPTVDQSSLTPSDGFAFVNQVAASAIIYLDILSDSSQAPIYLSPLEDPGHTQFVPITKVAIWFQQNIKPSTMIGLDSSTAHVLDFSGDTKKVATYTNQHAWVDNGVVVGPIVDYTKVISAQVENFGAPKSNALHTAIVDIESLCRASGGISAYFPPGTRGYFDSLIYYLQSSRLNPAGVVQPGCVKDLVSIVCVLRKTKIDFAVKCGGHETNPGFSCTDSQGILISMVRFNEVSGPYPDTSVDVGAGCIFQDVYTKLDPTGRNVVGATGIGVGVSGWLLGGGYSPKASQYGLGIDNILGIEIVLPTGSVEYVSNDHNRDLFRAIKGGGNNFGIVVRFKLATYPQGIPYAQPYVYNFDYVEEFKKAIIDFADNSNDEKANIEATFRYEIDHGRHLTVNCYYEDPIPPENTFKMFRDIPHKVWFGEIWKKQIPFFKYNQLISGFKDYRLDLDVEPGKHVPVINLRGRWGCIMVPKYTPEILTESQKQAEVAAGYMLEHGGKKVIVDIWPFLPQLFDKSSPAAWPHERGQPNMPLHVLC